MSTTSVYNALNSAITNNSINLWTAANGSTDLAGLVPVLELFGITSDYVVTNVVLPPSTNGSTVILTGQGSFVSSATYAVNVTLTYLQSNNSFTLVLAVKTPWVFSTFFGNLPNTLMQNPAVQPGITWYPSVLNRMTVNAATFTGQSLATALTLTGFLAQPDNAYLLAKTPMIGPWPLRLSGTVVMPDNTRNYPLIDLDATGNSTNIIGDAQSGINGPSAVTLQNPGLNLIVQPLVEEQLGNVAFSTIRLFGNFALGDITGRISTLILSTGDTWNFTVKFSKNATLINGLAQLTRIFGVELPIPMNFPVLKDFYVAEIDIDLQVESGSGLIPSFSLQNLAITIRSDKTWVPPVPFVTLTNVGTRWVWGWSYINGDNGQEKTYTLTGSVFGTFNFGSGGSQQIVYNNDPVAPNSPSVILEDSLDPVRINVQMSLPDFIISGGLAKDSVIPIGDALTYFFGNDGPSIGPQQMNVTRLRFTADPIGQNYFAEASILFTDPAQPDKPAAEQGWQINLLILTIILNELEFNISVNNGQVSGGIAGIFYLQQGDASDYSLPRIMLSAEYPPQDPDNPAGWTLMGYLYPGTSINLTELVHQFIYGNQTQPPSWVPDVTVDRLAVKFTTGAMGNNGVAVNPSYAFGGTISARWQPTIFGTTLKVSASASIDLEKKPTDISASGKITGTFSINRIGLTASLTFGVPEATYLFKVQFDQLWLQATTSWRGDENNRHQVISLQLGGVTLGDILEYLVNLAAPTIGFSLDSPWDVLKKIDLSRFVLTLDPKENVVEFVFEANVDLVIAQIKTIGVRYTKNKNQGSVNLILTGSFLGQSYTPDDPLEWDVINDPPPSVPGQGKSLVNLKYLGLGQHVTFVGDAPGTVAASVQKLKDNMPAPPANGSPMPQTMRYSKESQWLIGLDIELMETLGLKFIFNDPVLYGLSIALGGERAGSLAGLKFEILYKKITDDIGMFRVELQVPDMFRTIQLGVVSITLGIIVVEIYTNGNFKVDLGFPYNQDFSRSFSLQAYVFIGRGGFYLGVLNGDTSTQVPRISNGNFSPVIELGIGIAAGVGREIRAGILSGGAYIELQVIFQGVLAWFNPNSSGIAPATYFKCHGIAALHGKVYGSVDFVVVKVSVTLEAYAQVSIVYESYQPMLITFSVEVSAEASIKILFVRIYFSFSVKLEMGFTLGHAEPTPWILSENNNNSNSGFSTATKKTFALRNNPARKLQTLRRHYRTQLLADMRAGRSLNNTVVLADTDYQLHWNPSATVFSDSPRNAHLTLLPIFTIGDVPVNWDNTTPSNPTPAYRSAFVLFADTGMDPGAQGISALSQRNSAHSAMGFDTEDTSTLAADILTQGLVQYAINALTRPQNQGNLITAHDIALLLAQLDLPEAMNDGLSINNLSTFFNTNIHLWISGDVQPRPDEKSAMVIPMPPFLNWTSAQAGDVDFSNKNKIGSMYEWQISQLLNTYFPVGDKLAPEPTDDNPADYESFTSFMFRDFCLLLMQNGIKEMQKLLAETSVTVQTTGSVVQSLVQVANGLPKVSTTYYIHAGDTVESVAETLGATVAELVFLNPTLEDSLNNDDVGTELTIVLGIPPQSLAIDNADEPFAINQLNLGTVVHQANAGDTLQVIADLFNIPDSVGSPSAAQLLAYRSDDYISLSSGPNILKPQSSFTVPAEVFSNAPASYTKERTAAVFFVRYMNIDVLNNTSVPEKANWYVQAITSISANASLLQTLFPGQPLQALLELPPGLSLSVPNSYQAAYLDASNCNTYITVPGDTLGRIGYALVFQQDPESTASIASWQTFLAGVNAGSSANSWNIPAQTSVNVDSGQTFESLVRRLIVHCTWTGSNVDNPAEGTWTYDWVGVAQDWAANAAILEPLACVTVPNAKTSPAVTLSFSELSTLYGLSITDAATRLQDVNGLYASGTVLTVKSLPAQDISVLMAGILQGDPFTSIVNQSSRMLMSGLQLPNLKTENGHTVADTANLLPLYDLTGQQFTFPVNAAEPTEVALALSLQAEETWIQLFDSITVQAGQTLAQLETQYPDLLVYNPGLSAAAFKTGMVLLVAEETSLSYSYTNADVEAEAPASGLAVQPVPSSLTAPAAMALSGTVPRTYGLEHRIELQSPVALSIPQSGQQTAVTGNAGAWLFPSDLLAKARAGVITHYELLSAPLGGNAGEQATEIDSSTFGMLLPFKVKRMDTGNANFNLIGVDTDNRELLISLMTWLGSANTAAAYLAISPAPNAGNTAGLTILNTNADNAFLIKSNLSTMSMPPVYFARQANTAGNDMETDTTSAFYASLNSLANFTKLLWEGSVVGGTGYYFNAGQTLPGSAFDEQGNITLQLLVIAGSQQSVTAGGRSLLPFNNCVLVGAGIDTQQLSLYMQSAGSADPSETVTQALVPPGNVGFELLLNNPGDATDPQTRLKNLYSLLSFQIRSTSGSPFVATASGMPVLPSPSDGVKQEAWKKQRARRVQRKNKTAKNDVLENDAMPYWSYTQVMPVSRFTSPGTTMAAPNVNGLPLYTADPYIGYGTQSSLPEASFVFGFGDVLGNRTGANGSQQGSTSINVGYTDTLIGIGDWPSIARYYTVQASGNAATLSLIVGLRPSELLPTPSQRGDALSNQLAQQQKRFADIYYQLVQPNLQAWVVSSLNYVADTNYGNKGQQLSDYSPLWKFAGGAYAMTSGLAGLSAAKPQLPSSLSVLTSTYNVRYTELAEANADGLIHDLFGGTLPAVPAYLPYVENETITGMYQLAPKGWPLPASADALLTNDENAALPLKTGISLVIPEKNISTGSASPSVSMKSLADANNTSVSSLAMQNQDKTVLQVGFEFTVEIDASTEAVVTVSDSVNTLNLVVAAFAEQGVNIDVVGLCDVNQNKPNIFAIQETLTTTFYVVKDTDTLASNQSGVSLNELATNNLSTPNLFDPGALIFFNPFDAIAVDNTTTLRQLASRYGCSMEQILDYNASFTLPATSTCALPGTLELPADTSNISVPYTVRTNESLNTIASRFAYNLANGTAALQLATTNADMPATLIPDTSLSIPVGGTSYTVNTGSNATSFGSLLTTLQGQASSATMTDVVNAIGDNTSVLEPGALLICPLAKLASDLAPSGIDAIYGISGQAFALANTAIPGLIKKDQKLYAADKVKYVTTQLNDTFNSIITSFADQDVNVSASDIVDNNPDVVFLATGALAFVPPLPINFTVTLPENAVYEGPVVPLQSSLRILRPEALIPDEFRTTTHTGPVEMTESDFPAPLSSAIGEGSLNLNSFVTQITTAINTLRIGTGRVSGIVQDLWQVNFNAQGISQVELIPATTVNSVAQPRFFALAPLYKHLVNRTVPISALQSSGELGSPQDISFQNVDTELWARRFVEDMDRFLSGEYASAIYTDATIRTSLNSVLTSKQNLIPKIAGGLDTVLSLNDPGATAGLNSATESLRQQLGISLAKAYEANALVQYNSSVNSPYTGSSQLLPASLYGNGLLSSTVPGQVISGLSMISAKTDLSQTSSYANFIVMLDNPAFHRTVEGTFSYNISNYEFNITGQDLPDGYKSSDWLSFVPLLTSDNKPSALAQTDPQGTVNVPIPLRIFPDLPKIIKQQAIQSYADLKNRLVSELSLWDFDFIYSHQHAEQDYVLITAEFNLTQPQLFARALNGTQDLFSELAQYTSVADSLWNILNDLTNPASQQDPTVLAHAVQTYAGLVGNVEQYWDTRLPQSANHSNPTDTMVADMSYRYNARVGYRNEFEIDTYTLTLTESLNPGLANPWPSVFVQSQLAGVDVFIELPLQTSSATTAVYQLPQDVVVMATTWPVFKLQWAQLNVASVQNARTKISVERNQNLVDGVNTNPVFIFSTDTVVAPSVVTPLNTFGKPVDITSLGTDLTTALNTCFTDLFGSNYRGQTVTMELSYGYELVPPDENSEGLVTYLPIGLYPNQTLSSSTAQQLNTAVTAWKLANQPVENGGEWVFSLKLYSQMTQNSQTLLNIEHLFYRMGS